MEINLKKVSDSELALRLENMVRQERKITHLILNHILEFEDRKLYADLGFDSMFSYLTKHLGYGDSSAYRRLQSARLLRAVPEVGVKLESGELNLSQATEIQKCLKADRKLGRRKDKNETLEVIEKIQSLNSFETKMILAVEFDQPLQLQEKVVPQKDESVRLEITFSAEQYAELEKAKNLLSHVVPENSWADILSVLAFKFNKTKLGKSEVIPVEESTHSFGAKPKSSRKFVRRNISLKVRRQVFTKAEGKCEFHSKDGTRCNSTYQLQVDHIQPVSVGGMNSPDNLRALCRTHNLAEARAWGLG